MIDIGHIREYRGRALWRGEGFLYLAPHPALLPYIPCYTITFPQAAAMAEQYTILPTASSTMVLSVGGSAMVSALRGVDTRAFTIGQHANRFRMLVLVEFHPGGLWPFVPVDQHLLLNTGLPVDQLDQALDRQVRQAVEAAPGVAWLVERLNAIFMARLGQHDKNPALSEAMAAMVASHGAAGGRALSRQVGYSEKHLGRLFRRQVGVGAKTFGRIVRVNHALRLMDAGGAGLAQTAQLAGYFDQPHFIHDFTAICGLSPAQYLKKRSVFYNENFKL